MNQPSMTNRQLKREQRRRDKDARRRRRCEAEWAKTCRKRRELPVPTVEQQLAALQRDQARRAARAARAARAGPGLLAGLVAAMVASSKVRTP